MMLEPKILTEINCCGAKFLHRHDLWPLDPALTLFGPAYFGISGIRGGRGGHIVPPLNIFGLGGVRVPILFGNDLPRNDLSYSKGFMKFGCPEPSKKMFDF